MPEGHLDYFNFHIGRNVRGIPTLHEDDEGNAVKKGRIGKGARDG